MYEESSKRSDCAQSNVTPAAPASPAPWRSPARHPTLPQMPSRQTQSFGQPSPSVRNAVNRLAVA